LTGGVYQVVNGTLRFNNADIRTNAATIILDGGTAQIVDQSNNNALAHFNTNAAGGNFTIRNEYIFTAPGVFSNAGTVTVGPDSLFLSSSDYTQTAGTTAFSGGSLETTGTVRINGGVLSGVGYIFATVVNAGQLSVGALGVTGTLEIDGNYTQTGSGSLNVALGDFPSGEYGQLQVDGQATLAGTLNVTLLSDFTAQVGNDFQVLTFGSRSGNFGQTNLPNIGDPLFLDPQFDANHLTLRTRSH
jgi:hypothetical protein